MDEKIIKQKIKEIEEQLESQEINMVSIDYYEKLLIVHARLWDYLDFKKNSEATYLDPPTSNEKPTE